MRFLLSIVVCLTLSVSTVRGQLQLNGNCCESCGEYAICFGNMLDDPKYGPSIVGYEKQIPKIGSFYIYQNHLVGEYQHGYFIFDSRTGNVQTFTTKKAWEQARTRQYIEPRYWIDWISPYSDCSWLGTARLMANLLFVLGVPFLAWLSYLIFTIFEPKLQPYIRLSTILMVVWSFLIVVYINLGQMGSF